MSTWAGVSTFQYHEETEHEGVSSGLKGAQRVVLLKSTSASPSSLDSYC